MKISILLKKEILDYIRNKKLISILLIFSFFGIISPLTAYYIPEIMDHIAKSQNITIVLPPPTYKDAILQYVKNISQMCVFVLILINMGIVTSEKEKGTAIFVLVKPVSRYSFILSKYITALSVSFLALFASALCTAIYTYLFFNEFYIGTFIIQNLLIFLYISTILSLTIMYSTVSKSQILAGVLSFFSWISFTLFAQLGKAGRFSPDNLISMASTFSPTYEIHYESIITSAFIIVISLSVALMVFEKWEPK